MFSCIITRLRTYAQTRLTRIFSNFVKSTQRAALIAAEKTLDRIFVFKSERRIVNRINIVCASSKRDRIKMNS